MSELSFYDLTYDGPVVQAILDTAQKLRTDGYIFMGAGTPSTAPGTPTERVWYLCGPGTYANFGTSVTVPDGSVMVASYTNSTWTKTVIAINGGAAVSGWKVVDSVASLPSSPEDPSLGWIVDNTVYLYVGEGGDTLSGKYQSMGDFQGPQGEDGATGPQGPAGADGISIGDNWTAFSALNQLNGKTYAEKQAMVPDANAVEEVNTKIVDLGAQCTLPSQTTETVEGAVGQWQADGTIGTTEAIRAHLKISAKLNARLTVVIPSGWYGAFYYVDDSNASQGDISGGWKSGTYDFAVNGTYDIMVNIKYGSAGTTTINQSLLDGVDWTITHYAAGGYKAAAPYDDFAVLQGELGVVNETLFTDPSVKTLDNSNANVSNYKSYSGSGLTRGYLSIPVYKMSNYSVSLSVKNGSPIKGSIQGWTVAEDFNSAIYTTGWISPNNSVTYQGDDSRFVEVALIATYISGNTGIPTWSEFLQYIEFSVTYTDADGLVDRVSALEYDKIKKIDVDWLNRQLLTTTYYGERIRLTDNASTYAQLGTLQSGTSSRQGGAVFGNYLFQFHNTLASVCIFDLSTGQNVQKITNTAIADCHANSGGFSSQFYDVSDNFPLLYIGSMDECKVYVFRVTGAVGSLAMTLVQTITLSSLYYYTDIAVDNDNASLVIACYAKNSALDDANNSSVVMSCKIPSISGDVTISEFENVGKMSFILAHQGMFATFGKIYISFGNAASPYNCGGIVVYDYINRNVLNWIGVRAIGAIEPEACCQWGDKIVITTQDGKVYALSF